MKALRPVFKTFHGETPVIVVTEGSKETMKLSKELWVDVDSEVMNMLRTKLGEANVKVVEK